MRPRFWLNYLRYLWLRLRHPQVRCRGMVYLGRSVEIVARPGYGRLTIEAGTHIGSGSAVRAHEGNLHIGADVVLGSRVTVNTYLDVSIGDSTLIADDVYLIDFDHTINRTDLPIKDQGITKAPIRVGSDCWLGTKVVVLKGVTIGDGAVVGAGAVVTRDVPPDAIVAGVPARVIGHRAAP